MLILMDIKSNALLLLGCVLFSIFIWYLSSNKKDGPNNKDGPYKEIVNKDMGSYEKGILKNGKKEGPYEIFDINDDLIYKSNYKDGIEDGPFESIYSREDTTNNYPQVYEQGNYKNGELHGWYRDFHTNGLLNNEIFYENGVIEGIERSYDNQGNLTRLITWNYGEHDIYEDIAAELEVGLQDKGLFMRAEIEANGDQGKVRSIYLRLRYEKLLKVDTLEIDINNLSSYE